MGRYYNGDIEGKFMFGVQSSTAANRFGATGFEPDYIVYHFNRSHLNQINEELELLEKDYIKVQKFFEEKRGYTNQQLKEANISQEEVSNYADYNLGKKIKDFIEENGTCQFEAEL